MGTENSELRVDVRTTGGGELDKLAQSVRAIQSATESSQPSVLKTEESLRSLGGTSESTSESIKRFGESIRQHIETPVGTAYLSLGKLAESFGTLGVAASVGVGTITALGTSLFESAKKLGEFGVEMQNISIRTGLSAEQVSLFSFAAKAAGSDIGSFEMAMKMFSRALADNSEEGKKAKAELVAMGISAHDLTGALKPTGDLFLEISDGLNRMKNSAEQGAAAQELFSRAGMNLLPTLLKLRENLDFAKEHGVWAPSQEEIDHVAEYQRRILLIEDAWHHATHAVMEYSVAAGAFIIDLPGNNPQGFGGAQRGAIRQMGTDRDTSNVMPIGNLGAGGPTGQFTAGSQAASLIAQNRALNAKALAGIEPDSLSSQISAAYKDVAGAEAGITNEGFPEVDAAARKVLITAKQHLAVLLAQNAALEKQKEIDAERASTGARLQSSRNALLSPYARIIAERDQAIVGGNTTGDMSQDAVSDPESRANIAQSAQFQFLRMNQQSIAAATASLGAPGSVLMAGGGTMADRAKEDLAYQTKEFQEANKAAITENSEALKNLQKTLKEVDEEQKKRQEEFDKAVDSIAGGIFEAGIKGIHSGGVGKFFAGQALDQGKIMFENVIKDIAPGLDKMIPNFGTDGGPGGIFKRTLFSRQGVPGHGADVMEGISAKTTAQATGESAQLLAAIYGLMSGTTISLPSFPGTIPIPIPSAPGAMGTGGGSPASALAKIFSGAGGGSGGSSTASLGNYFSSMGSGPSGFSMYYPDNSVTAGGGDSLASYFSSMGADDAALSAGSAGGDLGSPSTSLAPYFSSMGMTGGTSPVSPASTSSVGALVQSMTALKSSFGTNAMLGASNPWATLTGGSVSTGAGTATTGSALGMAGTIGAIGAMTAAGYGVYQGATDFAKGGAYGAVGGVSKIAGSLAAIDPEPISKAILGSVALIGGVIDAIMGDPRVARQKQETKTLKYDHFFDPIAINASEGEGGNYSDYGRGGMVRSSPFSAFAPIQEPYADWRHNQYIPGRTGNIGSNPAPTITNYISAIDSASFNNFALKNSEVFANAVVKSVGDGHPIVPIMRTALGG